MLIARSPSCCEAQSCTRKEFAANALFGSVITWSYSLTGASQCSVCVHGACKCAACGTAQDENDLHAQVSEHASWSSLYYSRIIKAALKSVGAYHHPDVL